MTKHCPMCGTAGGWDLSDIHLMGRLLRTQEFPCGTRVETVGDFGIGKTVTSESSTCLRWQRNRLAHKVTALRFLVEYAYEEGAEDMAKDNADFHRSTSQAKLEDINNA